MRRVFIFAIVLLAFAAGRVDAQRTSCGIMPNARLSIEKQIGECSRLIIAAAAPRDHPTRAIGYYDRGLLHHLAGQNDLAIADYTSAIADNPNRGDFYVARGDVDEDIGKQDDAAADYAEAARHPADTPYELGERCWLRGLRGRILDRALADCGAALKESVDERYWLFARGFVHFRMEDYAAAIADCDAVIDKMPRNASAFYIRGLAKLRSGDAAGGNADIATARGDDDRVADTFAIYGVTP